MYLRPLSLSIPPQLGSGGGMPNPRKLMVASAKMAEPTVIVNRIIMGAITLGIQAIVRDITEQTRRRENMQLYLQEITRAQEDERKRISRELHDEIAQSLAAICLEIGSMTSLDNQLPNDANMRLGKIRSETEGILQSVRHFSHELRPGDLEAVGIVLTLEQLIKELSGEGKIVANLEVIGTEQRLPSEMEINIFRIFQEALRNIRKYSNASDVNVELTFTDTRIKISINDNGIGFNVPDSLEEFAAKGKLGLVGISERVKLLHGSLSLNSEIGEGTIIEVEIPLAHNGNSPP
ncbi:sensor histidine kinase [Chloroflexota bacterium]